MTQSGHWPTRNVAVQRRRLSPAVRLESSAWIYKRLRWGCTSGDLVLCFGREIAGVMSFVQLFFKRTAGSVDHPPAFDGQALADFFRPPRQVFIFVGLQELAWVVVGGAVQHPVAVPRPDRHIGNRIFVARDEMIVRKLPVEHVELA